jgi:glycine/D-amino acid oxidase-like deaminating enzyme
MGEVFDVAVIGGGMVGAAIAYGVAIRGARCVLLDGGDGSLRAARGNFGLVWSQGKGVGMPAYAAWTRASLDRWTAFSEAMAGAAGTEIGYRRTGGLAFCLGDEDFAERQDEVRRMHNVITTGPRVEMLDRAALRDLLPNTPFGPRVTGASMMPDDGHANPLRLLRGLHAGFLRAGGVHRLGVAVGGIEADAMGFRIADAMGTTRARKVVVAAGLGTSALAAQVGISIPLRPVRGQNMVTERLPELLPMPASALRQTAEGVIQIGVSAEEGQTETATDVRTLARMAARAVEVLPVLARARIVRAWGAMRPMTPDGYPAYAQSDTLPGAFAAVCHSGVTLSAVHASVLAEGILAGSLPPDIAAMHPSRFEGRTDVQTYHA